MYRFAAALLSATLLIASPALADRKGIAYVQAPEQSSGTCTGITAAEAFACAKKQCVDGGAEAADCLEVAYCFPGNWSVDVFKQVSDGPHWHEFYCGWGTKEEALIAGAAACDKELHPDLMECKSVRLIDEDGNETELE